MENIFDMRIDIDSDLIEEKSHSLLNFSFRMAINKKNGHLLKIVFDLKRDDVRRIGSHDDTNPIRDKDERKTIKDNIRKTGFNDFTSYGTVKAIVDMDTNERLSSATAVGIMCGRQDVSKLPLSEREKIARDKNFMGGNEFTVGQREDDEEMSTYKGTRPAKSVDDLINFQKNPVKTARGYQKESTDVDVELIEEASHGKLKQSFRLAVNSENGHKLKIVFDLNDKDVDRLGHDFDGTTPGGLENKRNITKTGHNNFTSTGTVKAIIDLDTDQHLQSAKAIGVMNDLLGHKGHELIPNANVLKNDKRYHFDDFEKRNIDALSKNEIAFMNAALRVREVLVKTHEWDSAEKKIEEYRVGQKESDPTYKSTRATNRMVDLLNNTNANHRIPSYNARGVHRNISRTIVDIKKITNDFVRTSDAVMNLMKNQKINDPFVMKNHSACRNDFIEEFNNFKKLAKTDDRATTKSVDPRMLDHQNQMLYDLEYMKKLLRQTKEIYLNESYEGGDNIMESILDMNINEDYTESKGNHPDKKDDECRFPRPTRNNLSEDEASKCKHSKFRYGGGTAWCQDCGWFLHPDGRITKTESGRVGKVFYSESTSYEEDFDESADNSPESNVDLTPDKAEQTLATLGRSIINNKGKVTEYTVNTIANIITNNLLSKWANGFNKLTIKLLPENSKIDFEFIPPQLSSKNKISNEFIKRFISGNETLAGYLHKTPEINIKVSAKLFKNMKSDKDLITCFKNAIKYYDSTIDNGANVLANQLMKLDTVTKELLSGPLNLVVIYPLSLLFVFQNINIANSNNSFKVDKEMVKTINKFVVNITTTYSKPEKEKTQIIKDLKELVDSLVKNVTYTETMRSLQDLPDTIKVFYNSGFDDRIKLINSRFEFEQCENVINPVIFNEKTTIKRLKKIPADLIAYIVIEGESIRSANDKMMIVSYAYGKLEIIEWYIELLEVGTKNYIVPHSKDYLVNLRTQLLGAIKTIMAVRIKSPDDPIISINYPKGYEG